MALYRERFRGATRPGPVRDPGPLDVQPPLPVGLALEARHVRIQQHIAKLFEQVWATADSPDGIGSTRVPRGTAAR